MGSVIQVRELTKVYRVGEREAGLGAAVRSLFHRRTRDVRAVDHIDFDIGAGEIVGFLGPNGAGKTTTLKMLAGLLHPTAGDARVLGYQPWRRDPDYLRQMTLIMGQRSQLEWDIPVIDSFELHRAVYNIPRPVYQRTLDELVELLELGNLLQKPVRNLSLGERMKCEIAVSLVHRPRVLFLDEPTIGLDVTMQRRIRTFIAEYNRRSEATVLLTSHYMADVEALCQRVIVIHHGRILFDGPLRALIERFSPFKVITVKLADSQRVDASRYGTVISQTDGEVILRASKADTPEVTARLLHDLPILDLTVQDPPIEEVIEQIFVAGATP